MILALYAIGSIQAAMELLPVWLASARSGHYGNVPFLWISLVTAFCAGAAAFGLWHGRRWTRLPFVISALSALGTWAIVALFGLGEAGAGAGTLAGVAVLSLIVVVLIALATRYVWRHT